MLCRICVVQIPCRKHVLDHAYDMVPTPATWGRSYRSYRSSRSGICIHYLKYLDHGVGIDHTDHTDHHLSEVCKGYSAVWTAQVCTLLAERAFDRTRKKDAYCMYILLASSAWQRKNRRKHGYTPGKRKNDGNSYLRLYLHLWRKGFDNNKNWRVQCTLLSERAFVTKTNKNSARGVCKSRGITPLTWAAWREARWTDSTRARCRLPPTAPTRSPPKSSFPLCQG